MKTSTYLASKEGDPDFIPLTMWDELGLHFDFPDEPNTVYAECVIEGSVDFSILKTSFQHLSKEYPLLRSKLVKMRGIRQKYYWCKYSIDSNPNKVIFHGIVNVENYTNLLERITSERLDPYTSILKIHLLTVDNKSHIILHAHHSAFDGKSLVDILCLLSSSYQGAELVTPAPTVKQLQNNPASSLTSKTPLVKRQSKYLPFINKITRIEPLNKKKDPGYKIVRTQLDIAFLKSFRNSLDIKLTINDLLLSSIMSAVDKWNTALGKDTYATVITMPIDIRESHAKTMLGNYSIAIPIGTTKSERSDRNSLFQSIYEQTSDFKIRASTPLSEKVDKFLSKPPLLQTVLLAHRFLGSRLVHTTIFSNLGRLDITELFGSNVSEFYFSTSARMPRGVGIGATGIEETLYLSLRFRPRLFDEVSANTFLDLIVKNLNEYKTINNS